MLNTSDHQGNAQRVIASPPGEWLLSVREVTSAGNAVEQEALIMLVGM
jgi:hypothetical protein